MANIVELRGKSDQQLADLLENAREEMFNLRFQHAATRLGNPIRIKQVRREMAQVQSVLHNRQRAIAAAAAHAPIAEALGADEYVATARYVYEDLGWQVEFKRDDRTIATALVNLNQKQPVGRRERAEKPAPQRVKRYEVK